MKFMLMVREDAAGWEALEQAERARRMAQHRQVGQQLVAERGRWIYHG